MDWLSRITLGIPCKGVPKNPPDYMRGSPLPETDEMNPEQLAWMEANKPLYTGCSLTEALPHLPLELRFV